MYVYISVLSKNTPVLHLAARTSAPKLSAVCSLNSSSCEDIFSAGESC